MTCARSMFGFATGHLIACLLLAAVAPFAQAAPCDDLKLAPPSFQPGGKQIVFVDIQRSRTDVTFDVAAKTISVKTTVEFFQGEDGFPVRDLVPEATSIELNGVALASSMFPEVAAPTLRILFAMLIRSSRPEQRTRA